MVRRKLIDGNVNRLNREIHMNEQLKSQIDEMILKLPSNVYGKGVSKDDIVLSEEKYQMALPSEYQWFLEKYGYIVLWGEMTKTIFEAKYQDDAPDDIFNYYQINIADNDDDQDKLIFLATEELEEFYFPIVGNQVQSQVFFRNMWGDDELYANNFLEFLLIEIPKNYHRILNDA